MPTLTMVAGNDTGALQLKSPRIMNALSTEQLEEETVSIFQTPSISGCAAGDSTPSSATTKNNSTSVARLSPPPLIWRRACQSSYRPTSSNTMTTLDLPDDLRGEFVLRTPTELSLESTFTLDPNLCCERSSESCHNKRKKTEKKREREEAAQTRVDNSSVLFRPITDDETEEADNSSSSMGIFLSPSHRSGIRLMPKKSMGMPSSLLDI